MNAITVSGERFVDIDTFMNENDINSKKTVYNWVQNEKAIMKKMFNQSFFRKA